MVPYNPTRHDYYVYLLFCERGHPLYVGKGCNNRWNDHENEVNNHVAFRRSTTFGSYLVKDHILADMIEAGKSIPKVKLAEGLTLKDALIVESMFIKALGGLPGGTLLNVGLGRRSPRMLYEEWRKSGK